MSNFDLESRNPEFSNYSASPQNEGGLEQLPQSMSRDEFENQIAANYQKLLNYCYF